MNLLLDTHIFLWWFEDPRRLSKAQQRALGKLGPDRSAQIADITLWEIATLASLGRIRPRIPLREWLEAALERPYLEVQPITPAIAAEVDALGDRMHRDPADRLIVATARVRGATLLTQDQRIIDVGLAPVIA